MNFLKRLSMRRLERKVKAAAREVRPGLSLLLEADFETLKQAVLDEGVRRLAEAALRPIANGTALLSDSTPLLDSPPHGGIRHV